MMTLMQVKPTLSTVYRPSRIDRGSGVRVHIREIDHQKKGFRIRLPMSLVRTLLLLAPVRFIRNFPAWVKKKDLLKLLTILEREGLLVDVFDDGKFIQVRIGRISQNHFMEGSKMTTERIQVLKMLEEGKITADEADKLLSEIGPASNGIQTKASGAAKMIRIRVFEGNLDKPKVRVSIPLSLAKFAMHFVPNDHKAKINDLDIDLDEIIHQIEEGAEGHLVDVEDVDEESGKPTKVEIFVE